MFNSYRQGSLLLHDTSAEAVHGCNVRAANGEHRTRIRALPCEANGAWRSDIETASLSCLLRERFASSSSTTACLVTLMVSMRAMGMLPTPSNATCPSHQCLSALWHENLSMDHVMQQASLLAVPARPHKGHQTCQCWLSSYEQKSSMMLALGLCCLSSLGFVSSL